jgi:uncharacterized protein YjcR
MTNTIPNKPGYLTSMALANRYGISIETLRHWKNWKDWPADCQTREGQFSLYRVEAVDKWLRNRPVHKKGSTPRWRALVGSADDLSQDRQGVVR